MHYHHKCLPLPMVVCFLGNAARSKTMLDARQIELHEKKPKNDLFMMRNNRDDGVLCDKNKSTIPRISVVLLAGLPASGKSTLAREIEERFNEDDRTCGDAETPTRTETFRELVHIEYDVIEDDLLSSVDTDRGDTHGVEEAIGSRRRDAWNQARQKAVERMETEIRKIRIRKESPPADSSSTFISPSTGRDVIILMDDNFHLRGMRKQIHRLLLNYKPIRFGIIYLETPLDVCLERNSKRSGSRQIPKYIIEKMNFSFEPPRAAWEVCSTKTVVNNDFEEIIKFIEECPSIVDLPDVIDEKQQAEDRAKTLESEIHSLDKLLRSYVGRVAKVDKRLAKRANLAKKTVLEEFKSMKINNEGVNDTFLNLVLKDSPLASETDPDTSSTIRSRLQGVLDSS